MHGVSPMLSSALRGYVAAMAIAVAGCAAASSNQENPAAARMVDQQLRPHDIVDPRVLAAMREVPRHRFVPPERAAEAYDDTPLPIGYGQTISQPYIVAYMTQALELEPGHRVLE